MTNVELAYIKTASTRHMDYEERLAGIDTMMNDLERLAKQDGCIAAAWAIEFLRECPTFGSARYRPIEETAR